MLLDAFGGVRSAPRLDKADKKSCFEKTAFFAFVLLFESIFVLRCLLRGAFGKPEGGLGLSSESWGAPRSHFGTSKGCPKSSLFCS